MRSFLLALVFVTLAPPALASDGVLEISQTCAVQTGCFSGDSIGFPVEITTPGSYRLTSNLIVPDEFTDGIQIITSDVGIDLNNFAIIRSGCEGETLNCMPTSGSGAGIREVFTQYALSVKNGSITGMGNAGVALGRQAEVSNMRVRWNRTDGIRVSIDSNVSRVTAYSNGFDGIDADRGSTVSGSTAYRNGANGISAFGGAVAVSGNVVTLNTGAGIHVGPGSTVSGNTVYNNDGQGIDAGSGSTVSGNTVTQSTLVGLRAAAGSTVVGNTVSDNTGGGIQATGGASNISDNTIKGNGGTGIDCTDGGQSNVRGNSVIENTGFGIDLVDPARPDGIYRNNLVYDNAGGTVTGGVSLNRGGNTCRNFSSFSDCP